ncbi:hypothetical protein [Parenemella sanctibonifatiensis]|uniref:DUF4352 domain-containing protein n=1 Tax=Parenemella sanctibonifatiensis TaxID=2016505 RepID=A0A255E8R7_9ACTN|nr:hypothetical protein [Parenemella sanctibonifatiensis]OYN87964.1 hypothetical protein CGZ92_06820 [Parenemella sanctibonifatiensis]
MSTGEQGPGNPADPNWFRAVPDSDQQQPVESADPVEPEWFRAVPDEPTTKVGTRRAWWFFLPMLAVSLAAAGFLGFTDWASQRDIVVAAAANSGTAAHQGREFRLLGFEERSSVPATRDGETIAAPDGSVIVVATVEVTVAEVPDSWYCVFELRDADERVWARDGVLLQGADTPMASCSGTEEQPLVPGEPRQLQVYFVVPADAVDNDLRLRVRWDGQTSIDLRP